VGGAVGPTRRTAVIVWCGLSAGVVALAAVATAVGPTCWQHNGDVAGVYAWVALGMAPACLLVSRLLPGRIKVTGATPEAVALQRMLIASALNNGSALFAVMAWILGGSGLSVFALVISMVGLLLAFPSAARWRSLCGDGAASDRAATVAATTACVPAGTRVGWSPDPRDSLRSSSTGGGCRQVQNHAVSGERRQETPAAALRCAKVLLLTRGRCW
jgi:hypothetical protein